MRTICSALISQIVILLILVILIGCFIGWCIPVPGPFEEQPQVRKKAPTKAAPLPVIKLYDESDIPPEDLFVLEITTDE